MSAGTSARCVLAVVVLATLAGCSALAPIEGETREPSPRGLPAPSEGDSDGEDGEPVLQALPGDALRMRDPEWIDKQRILWDRGLYYNRYARVRFRGERTCPDLSLEAHRGASSQPGNSRSAALVATVSGFDALEIDVRQLRNERWVAHHDRMTGRATGRRDGDWQRVAGMDDEDWRELRHRDMDTGDLLDSRPATLREILRIYAAYSSVGQTINIDVKGGPDEDEARALDRMVRAIVGETGYYYSSGSMETLEALREANGQVYLGLIQGPHRRSIAKVRGKLELATGGDPIYQQHERLIQRAADGGSWWYGRDLDDYTSLRALNWLHDKLGPRAGLHLDIRRYAEVPAVRHRAARAGLVRVATYSINGPDYHLERIAALDERDALPDAVITDYSVYRFCARLRGAPSIRGTYEPVTALGQRLQRLPRDADWSFERLEAQGEYLPQSLYLDLDGRVRSLAGDGNENGEAAPSGDGMEIPDLDKGEAPDLGESAPVTIDIQE